MLEDLQPFSAWSAITRFYEVIAHINADASAFESNDLYFRGPAENQSKQFAKNLQCVGRVNIFFRDLLRNCSPQDVVWLEDRIEATLTTLTPQFPWGCIALSTWDTFFTPIDREGHSVILRFWAWGDSDAEVMDHLAIVISNMGDCLKVISEQIRGR